MMYCGMRDNAIRRVREQGASQHRLDRAFAQHLGGG